MFFRKKDDLQRLNLEAPKPGPNPPSAASPATQFNPHSSIDAAKLEAVSQRAKEILASGRIPEWLFVCLDTHHGLIMIRAAADQKPVMLLFSSPFGAADYLRAMGMPGKVGQLKVETLPESAQSWLSSGVQSAVLDRCPRCPQCLLIDLVAIAKWTKEDFAKVWAQLRAVRSVMGEVRIRSAMKHLAAGSRAAARSDLEYVRDHFDCGVPYLHQMIGLLAGMQQDELGKATAMERLKEFGPQFEGPLEFSPELLATAMVGLTQNFGPPAPSSSPTAEALPGSPVKPAPNVTPDPPKPCIRFQNPNGAPSFLAHPVKFMPGHYQQNVIQPGSHDSLGNPGIWANDMVGETVDWIDNPDAGLFSRKLYVVEDACGAIGRIDGMPYALGAVLQIGQNVVIYQLENLDTGEYIVYGFPIDFVDAVGAMARYLQRVGEKKEQLSTAALDSMADRILERFPSNDAALFNKGVALISEQRFAEAHEYFERALSLNSNDQLTILYDAAALAGMGQHKSALMQFAKADSISEEWVCKNIGAVGILPEYLSVSVSELTRADPGNQHYADLWSKYFPSVEIGK